MDVLQVIQEDHDEFRQQLATLTETATTAPEESVTVFRSLYDHLTAHHETEEQLLFKKLQDFEDAKSIAEEAWEEHEAIHLYLERMKQSHKTERWEGKTAVLKELVEHHLEEEEGEVFEVVRTRMGDQLDALGEKFERQEEKRLSK